MRQFKRGDIVSITDEALESLKYVPNFPQEITSNTGRITSVWRLLNTDEKYVTVQLDICPDMENLQFDLKYVDLLIPVELEERLRKLEEHVAYLRVGFPTF